MAEAWSMFGWLNSRAREIRQLNRDAASIVEMARQTYRADRQREIALLARDDLRQVEELCSGDAECMARELDRFKVLHREARRQLDQVGLTAHTLAIIHVRSAMIGQQCAPARETIEGFIDGWEHAADGKGMLAG